MAANFWNSTATFKQCTAEKLSFVFLNLADLALTLFAVNIGLGEVNPFMSYMLGIPVLLVAVKCVIPLLIAWVVPGKLLLPSIALLALVFIWNIKELFVYLF